MPDTAKEGPATTAPAELLAWCEKSAGKTLQLPLDVTRAGLGYTVLLGVGADATRIKLDSTALSMTLDDHLSRHCEDVSKGCKVWIEGKWGPLMEAPPGLGADKPVFTVFKVLGPVDDLSTAKGRYAP